MERSFLFIALRPSNLVVKLTRLGGRVSALMRICAATYAPPIFQPTTYPTSLYISIRRLSAAIRVAGCGFSVIALLAGREGDTETHARAHAHTHIYT